MNKIFIDTEFTDFIQMDLISLGAITEDGEYEFYVERHDYEKSWSSAWVKENVIPFLHTDGHSHYEAGLMFYKWLKGLPKQPEGYQICCDYEGDVHLLLDLLDGQDPFNIQEEPAYINSALFAECVIKGASSDLSAEELLLNARFKFTESFVDYFYLNKLIQHHALNDAKATRHAWLAALKSIRS